MSESIFSRNLKAARKLKGWSQKEAAQRLFRSRRSYAKWEEGRAEPSHETLVQICEVFGIGDLISFLGGEVKKVA